MLTFSAHLKGQDFDGIERLQRGEAEGVDETKDVDHGKSCSAAGLGCGRRWDAVIIAATVGAKEPVAAVIPIQTEAQPNLVNRRSGRRQSLSTHAAPIKAIANDEQVMPRVMFNFVVVF
jgi:hypothetical protein